MDQSSYRLLQLLSLACLACRSTSNPPEKPENLSCMAVQSDQQISSSVTCTWQPGKVEEETGTTFTLFGSIIAINQNYSTKAQESSGCINFGTFPSYMELDIWVDVQNNFGKVRSDILAINDPNEMVKTNPPSDVNIISENTFSRTLLVSWKHPIHETIVKLKYNIRFCTVGSGDWTEVPPNDTESSKESFRLQNLKPDMEHVVQVRCMHYTGYGYWSDWSANTTARTPEDSGLFLGSITTYGTIIPQSPIVEIGMEFTATCVVNEAAKATVDNIYWTCGGVTVPKEQYTKINDSAVNVTIHITRETGKWLLCKKNESSSFLNKSKTIHGIHLIKGYPPEKPENLSCMAVQSDQQISSSVTCTWQPGKVEEETGTTFTLFGSIIAINQNYSTKAQESSGCINFGTFPSYMELDIWVDVQNYLGKVQSDILAINDPNEMVKTNPPSDVNIISENTFSRTLLVSWKHPIHETIVKLKYNIRFCTVGSGDWTEVPPNDTESSKESFRLQNLKPDMEHVVQVRCMHYTGYGYWSDWSANTTARTPEDKPTSKPDLSVQVLPAIPSQRKYSPTVGQPKMDTLSKLDNRT